MKKLFTFVFALALSAGLLVGCALPAQNAAAHQHSQESHSIEILPELAQLAAGGVLRLKINPEIALHYDENGMVTKLEGRNQDGVQLLESFTGYEGKETSVVLEELVQLIGQAGYFVEEADGSVRRIVLELDPGSQVPSDRFLQDMAEHVKACVESKTWTGEREYEYNAPAAQEPTVPVAAEPVTQPAVSSTVPAELCPVCADDDCNDGQYCDDADDKKENLKEYENRKNGTPCEICADYDCDDGKYCDDWDDRDDDDDDDD